MNLEDKKKQAQLWFRNLRDTICAEFEALEDAFTTVNPQSAQAGRFERKNWQRTDETPDADGGGGEISILRGAVFEKAAVNISTVYGSFSEKFMKEIPGASENDGKFWASGISLITHPKNPYIPPVHMNTRMIVTAKHWFGGGADLNPIFPNDADSKAFHHTFKTCCDQYHPDYYPKFSAEADRYFSILHRNIKRGIGGIFYDYLESGDWQKDFAFTQDVGKHFLEIYPALVRKHLHAPYDDEARAEQLIRRGYYTEFNLVYDRGTRFGLMTGGNVEAVLASLPPLAAWP